MSAQMPPAGGPGGPDDLERLLAEALRRDADRVVPAGDGLAKIRERTARNRASAFAWLRPQALVGGAAAIAVVALGVVVVGQMGGDGDSTVVQEPPNPIVAQKTADTIPNEQADDPRTNPTVEPFANELGTGGVDPVVDTQVTDAPADAQAKLAPVTPEQERSKSDGGIPIDDGGNYVSILAPLSGGTYGSPLTLAGQARIFENHVTIDVSQNGTVLKRAYATATAGPPDLGDWQATIALAPGNYRIDAYALSPENGTTKLASDSIWITIRSATSSPSATPTASATSSPSPTSSARPTSTGTPAPGTAGSPEVPATEPDA